MNPLIKKNARCDDCEKKTNAMKFEIECGKNVCTICLNTHTYRCEFCKEKLLNRKDRTSKMNHNSFRDSGMVGRRT
jgi:hypothetical protein